jgi:hypothetical protein
VPEDDSREIVRKGEVLPPAPIAEEINFWRRRQVRVYGSGLFLLGIAAWLGQNFFQLRGYVNLLASRIDLYCAAALVVLWIWIWARNIAAPKILLPAMASVLIFIMAFAMDRLTLPHAALPPVVSPSPKEQPQAAVKVEPPVPPKKTVFPGKPLELVMFIPFKNGTLQNISNETLFVSDFGVSSMIAGREDSMVFPVGAEVKPYGKIQFDTGVSGTWDTLVYASDDWDTASRSAIGSYKQCVRPLAFLPDSLQFKDVVNHYRSMGNSIPIGDAKGTISYRRGSNLREEVIGLKALLFSQRGCVPQ